MLQNRFAPLLEDPLSPASALQLKGADAGAIGLSAPATADAAGFAAVLKMLPEGSY